MKMAVFLQAVLVLFLLLAAMPGLYATFVRGREMKMAVFLFALLMLFVLLGAMLGFAISEISAQHWLQEVSAGAFGVMAFGIVFSLVIGALGLSRGAPSLRLAWQSRSWPTVPGVMEGATITEERDADGLTWYAVRVEYRYSVPGAGPQAGDCFAFGREQPRFFFLRSAERFFDQKCQAGSRVEVFYDPRDPSRAVLQRGRLTMIAMAIVVFALTCAAAGLAGLYLVTTG